MFDSFAAICNGMSDSLGRVGMCSGLAGVSREYDQLNISSSQAISTIKSAFSPTVVIAFSSSAVN